MLVTDLIQLIETLRKLIQRKSELDKEYFDSFIQPLWIIFNEVHNDYMESLRKYSRIITKEDCDIASLVNEIQQDSIYSAEMRIELYNLAKTTPSFPAGKNRANLLVVFFDCLQDYFGAQWNLSENEKENEIKIAQQASPVLFGRLQAVRHYLVVYLSRKGLETNRKKAKEVFDKVALDRQHHFEGLSRVYAELKKEFLT